MNDGTKFIDILETTGRLFSYFLKKYRVEIQNRRVLCFLKN